MQLYVTSTNYLPRRLVEQPEQLCLVIPGGEFKASTLGPGLLAVKGREVSVLEIVIVHVSVGSPLLWNGVLGKDGHYRTNWLAGGTVDALVGVDIKHVVVVRGVDAINRTNIHACAVLNIDARFSDDIGHWLRLLLNLRTTFTLLLHESVRVTL